MSPELFECAAAQARELAPVISLHLLGEPFMAESALEMGLINRIVPPAEANALAPLRIAVNNAGIGGEQATIGDYTLEGWRHVIEINLNAVMYGLKAQLPAMAENGGGSIVNMASILGSVGCRLDMFGGPAHLSLGSVGSHRWLLRSGHPVFA